MNRVPVQLGTPSEKRDFQIANVEYRCRDHHEVRCGEVDYCWCGQRLAPVVPVSLMFVDDDEWVRMLEERNEDENLRRLHPSTNSATVPGSRSNDQ